MTLRVIKWGEVVPRMVADFAIIHCAMLIAFAISIAYQTRGDEWWNASNLANAFRRYYFWRFLFLSPLFPTVFFLNGLYTHVRSYRTTAKLERFTGVVLLSLSAFIAVNYLVIPHANPIGRSVSLTFGGIALVGLVGIRVGKEWLWSRLCRLQSSGALA